jgi:DNA polymerase III subunit epsilon
VANFVPNLGYEIINWKSKRLKMNLKKCIISILNKDSLKNVCRKFDLATDYRSKDSMAKTLARQRKITAENLLACLKEEQVKAACDACGILSIGRRGELIKRLLWKEHGPNFVAIDFETADNTHGSVCAIGLVRVEKNKIIRREYNLIRPPQKNFIWTHVHRITWDHVKDMPIFLEIWQNIIRSEILEGIEFIAAHNAPFERKKILACCKLAGLNPPNVPFLCTMRLSHHTWKEVWNLKWPPNLGDVCHELGITLENHHNALEDAEACAHIVIKAREENPDIKRVIKV